MKSLMLLLMGIALGFFSSFIWDSNQPTMNIPTVSIVNFSYLDDQTYEEIQNDIEKAVRFHGPHEQYFYHRGKLLFERNENMINAIATMKSAKKLRSKK